MTVEWPTAAGWSLVAAEAIAVFAWWMLRRGKRFDERWEAYKQGLADEIEASKAFADKVRHGSGAEVREAKRILDAKRKALDELRKAMHLLVAFFAVATLTGCATRERERIVTLDEHIRIVAPGDTVPDYADGENRWWLVSPTGLVGMVPEYRQAEF